MHNSGKDEKVGQWNENDLEKKPFLLFYTYICKTNTWSRLDEVPRKKEANSVKLSL